MWLRRWPRRRREPPPVLLPSLDRLAELIERVAALLDNVTLAPEARVEQAAGVPEAPVDGWIAFVPSPDGYRVLPQAGPPPARNASVELEVSRFQVLRLGPSPLPGDRRRCAFLSREETPPPTTEEGAARRGANLRRVKEESQIEDMRAALRGDRERADQARERSIENVRALIDAPPVDAEPEPERSRGLLVRLLGR